MAKKDAKPTTKPATEKKEKKRKNQPVPPEISEARERLAYELRIVRGMKLYEITDELNKQFPAYPLKSDHEAVRKMIERVRDEYAKRDKGKIDEVLAETAATFDWVKMQAIEAFESSKQLSKTVTQREQKPIEQKVKSQTGDAMHLKRVLEAADLKSKLFGAVAPQKREVTGKDGAPLHPSTTLDLNILKEYATDDDLAILQKASEVLERIQRDHDLAIQKGDRGRTSGSQS